MKHAVFMLVVNAIVLAASDNLALLSGTLRTFQQAGCDDDVVTLKCPPGTSISVELAQYGKAAPHKQLCPQQAAAAAAAANANGPTNISCLWPTALQSKWDEMTQGTWGRTVVEACQKKSSCKFQASPKTFEGDPCPGERKYVEVAYKCRPYEFRSRVACENERIQLQCNPNSRVAVYSASYGRTEYESFQCPQPQGVAEETCLVSYATETVMQICHGKRGCELSADASTFGNPCRPQTRMYLRVVYTCVPRKVLNKQYEGRLEEDEVDADLNLNYDQDDFDSYDSNNEHMRESAASPPAPNLDAGGGGGARDTNQTKDFPTRTKFPPHAKSEDAEQVVSKTMRQDPLDPNCTVVVYVASEESPPAPPPRNRVIGFLADWINTYTFVAQNQERFYLYLILSLGVGVLLCLLLLVARLLVQRHRARRDAKFHATNISDNTIPNGFADDISEVDADIDLTTPLPVPTVAVHSPTPMMVMGGVGGGGVAEVVRYPHVHTLRRGASGICGSGVVLESELPRSLNATAGGAAPNSIYYYG